MLWSKRLLKSCVIWLVRLPYQPSGASVMLNVPETTPQNYQWTILQKFAIQYQASLFEFAASTLPSLLPGRQEAALFLFSYLLGYESRCSSHPKSPVKAPVSGSLVKHRRLGDLYIKQLFPYSPGSNKLEIKVWVGLIPSGASLFRL